MSMSATQDQIALALSKDHVFRLKIELLNQAFQHEDDIEGDVSDISFNIDSSSDIRRSSSVTIGLNNGEFSSEEFEVGWLNRIVRISIGIDNGIVEAGYTHGELAEFIYAWMEEHTNEWLHGNDHTYFVLGSMLLTQDNYEYNETSNSLSLNLVDLMAIGTSARGSQIGTPVKIEFEANIKEALEAVAARYMKCKSTDIDEFPDVIPFDQEFSSGSYAYDILSQVIGLFPTYEQYFDSDGIYHVHQIPTHIDEPVLLDETVMDEIIISERRALDISGIKNSTEIWGKEISADYAAVSSTYDSTRNTYEISFLAPLQNVEAQAMYSFTATHSNLANPKVKIPVLGDDLVTTEYETINIYDSNGRSLPANALSQDTNYVFLCTLNPTTLEKMFLLQGEHLIHVIVREMNAAPSQSEIERDKALNDCRDIYYVVNPESSYACDRNGFSIEYGEMRQVLEGGDYSYIYTTQLAYERGKYENYLKTRLNTDVELTTILVPFMDVNKKIQYTSPITGEVHQYIIKSIDFDILNYTMTMSLSRFYNYYPF